MGQKITSVISTIFSSLFFWSIFLKKVPFSETLFLLVKNSLITMRLPFVFIYELQNDLQNQSPKWQKGAKTHLKKYVIACPKPFSLEFYLSIEDLTTLRFITLHFYFFQVCVMI